MFSRTAIIAALSVLLVIGFWLRVRHVGDLGLVVDEGNQVLAVRGILEHGIPKVESGKVYTRGLPFLYLEAAVANRLGLDELSLRLPSVVLGTACILAVYWLGSSVSGSAVGLLAALLIAFSVWEIEMSRYARFYTGFQLSYILAIIFFYKGFLENRNAYRLAFFGAALLAFSFHELGVMVVALFLIPILSFRVKLARKLVLAVLAAVTAGIWAIYPKLLAPLYAHSTAVSVGGGKSSSAGLFSRLIHELEDRLVFPRTIFIEDMISNNPFVLLVFVLVGVGVTAFLVIESVKRGRDWKLLLLVPAVWAGVIHQFTIAALLFLLFVIVFVNRPFECRTSPLITFYVGLAGLFVGWSIVIFDNASRKISMAKVLFGYPDIYKYFLTWFIQGWPVLIVVLGVGVGWLLIRYLRNRDDGEALFLLGALLIPIILTSFLKNEFYEARYTFHLYPIVIIVVSTLCVAWVRWALVKLPSRGRRAPAATALVIALLVGLGDSNPVSAWSVGDRTYRSTKDPIKGHINWRFYSDFHQDQKSPSLYVREHRRPGDRVIAVGPPHMVAIYHYYSGRVDFSVSEKVESFHPGTAGRRTDHMVGSPIIDDVEMLHRMVEAEAGTGVWLLCDRRLLVEKNRYFSESMKDYLRSLSAAPEFVGDDGQTFAVRVR